MTRNTEHPPAQQTRSASSMDDNVSAPECIPTPRDCAQPESSAADDGHETLIDIIKGDIIPRLMLVHQNDKNARMPFASGAEQVPAETISELADIAAGNDDQGAFRIVESALAKGLSLDGLLLNLIAPAAEQLGLDWENDRRDFSSVTIGLWRLHILVREFAPRYEGQETTSHVSSILVAPAPGEQHTLGPLIVAEFFHRAGWAVIDLPVCNAEGLTERVAAEHFDVLGLSVASDLTLNTLAGTIRDIRDASRNPDIGVLVGGRIFSENANLSARVGADALCLDPRQAPVRARELLAFKNKKANGVKQEHSAYSRA